jgi:hypothetical protein
MGTDHEYSYTAHIVIASEHAGLSPVFKAFENEMYRVLARVDDPREVRNYLQALIYESRRLLAEYIESQPKK